ncbi:chemotaxis protein [Niveispirillum sp. KHB5.9]|uniref:chemotaxis protein n=1 Tax=Niveispirillum sp. KHB5.9 TaxID=3400269 RepID=UPI003A8A3B81
MQFDEGVSAITGTIGAAAMEVEKHFLDIGGRLERAVETLTRLTGTFERLSGEMQGQTLHLATRDLAQVAEGVAALAPARGGDMAAFTRLLGLTGAIGTRIANMERAVKGVGTLAVNAKIAAAHIGGETGVDFISFAAEINRTLALAERSLERFGTELTEMNQNLRQAVTSQVELEARQADAVETIPRRLRASVEAVAAHGNRNAALAVGVGQGTQRIGQRVSDIVMALQISDITRQRIEHVGLALDLAPPSAADDDAAFLAFCWRLQADQLDDTADELDREVERIKRSLLELAGEAGDILRQGEGAFGAAGTGRGSFVGALEAEVALVDSLFAGFRAAREDGDRVAAIVSDAATRLVQHMRTIRSLETDIRIMGLNTTLKCNRLGTVGRPLAIIAQELRLYANEIAAQAAEVMGDIDQVAAAATDLSGDARAHQATDIATITDSMGRSMAHLSAAGRILDDAFAQLGHDGRIVADLLQQTAAGTDIRERAGSLLRREAARLTSLVPADVGAVPTLRPRDEELATRMLRSYTMERERVVFDRHAPDTLRRSGGEEAAADMDDIFF